MTTTLAVILLTMTTLVAQTPALPTIDQILDKQIEAVGGRAALEKLQTITGKGNISIEQFQLSGTIQLFQKPDKSLQILDLTGVGTTREGFDGTVGWVDQPQQGIVEKTGLELAEARRGAIMPRELKMKQLYPKMAVTGRGNVDGKPAYIVDATPVEGPPVKLYFDAASGLLVRQIATRSTPQGPIEVDTVFSDYRDVSGLKRPFAITQATSQFTARLTFTEIQQNVLIDDAMFKKPGLQ
ncbi:MAG TPA: hypothetical protein VFV98_07230 [Vicinamibacterales bacterium]|nr:hypothetical protein [Vicinamibacterales bacterium]